MATVWGIANFLTTLGLILIDLEQYQEADRCGQEALAIAQQIGSNELIPRALIALGATALGQGNFQTSRQYFYQALVSIVKTKEKNLTWSLTILLYVATLFVKEANFATQDAVKREMLIPVNKGLLSKLEKEKQAVELLTLVKTHSSTIRMFKDKAVRLLLELEAKLSPEAFATAQAQGQARDLQQTAQELLGELSD